MCTLKRATRGILGAAVVLTLLFAGILVAGKTAYATESVHEVPQCPISLGGNHSMAIKSDGSLWAWGSGELGIGSIVGRQLSPARIEGLDGVRAISSGSTHSLAIRLDGSLWAWGSGMVIAGDKENSVHRAPVRVPLGSVSQVSTGLYHSAAVTSDGSLWTWGTNSSGQLGNGTTESSAAPLKIEGMDDVLTIAMGDFHSAAVKTDGSLWMWGRSLGGALGNGDKYGTKDVLSPIEVMQGVAAVSLGYNVSAAVKFDGTLWTWGGNAYGQLGDGTGKDRAEPGRVEGIDDVVAVSFGTDFAAAIKADGTLWMWGRNGYGQLGDGTTEARLEPTRVKGLDNVVAVSLGNGHTAALTSDGSLWMWGWGINGQLGTGKTETSTTPVLVMKGVMLPDTIGLKPESPDQSDDPSNEASKYVANVRSLISSVGQFGSATLVGPSLDILGNKVTLFQSDIAVNLDLNEATASVSSEKGVVYNADDGTVEVIFGAKGTIDSEDSPESGEADERWRETYNAVKSFVESCKNASNAKDVLNRFASLKGELKRVKSDIIFDADASYLGYAKFQIGPQGRCGNLIEGSVVAHAEMGVYRRVPLWAIAYSEFGFRGEADGNILFNLSNNRLALKGDVGVVAKPSIALGADAVVADLKGGIEGEIGGNLQLTARSIEDALKLHLTGRFFWSADTLIPGLSQEGSYDFPSLELYPHLGEVTPQAAALAYEAPEVSSIEDLAQLEGDPSLLSDTVAAPAASTVYENAKPSAVQLPDGRYLCTYLDTVADGTVRLMYRVLNGGKWSDAKPVAAQSNAALSNTASPLSRSAGSSARVDTAGVLASASDGSTWVVYERAAGALHDGVAPEDIAGLMELRAARFDASSATFGESIVVAPAGTWKYAYSIGESADGKPAVVWAENSANDVLLKSGGTRLYRAKLSEGIGSSAEELFSCDKVVAEVVAFGDHYAFVENGKLRVDGVAVDTATLGSTVDGLHESNGALFFRCDGKLCSYTLGEGIEPCGARCTTKFAVHNDRVYWVEQDGFYSEIYRSDLTGEGIAAVTEDGAYVGDFSVVANDQGGDGLLYTCQSVSPSAVELGGNPFGVTVLKYDDSLARTRIEIADAAYDAAAFDPASTNRVVVTVENTGTEPAADVAVEARDAGGNIVAMGELNNSIAPGESADIDLSVTFPQGSTSFGLNFAVVVGGSAQEPSDATLEMEAEYDISIARKRWQLPGNYHLVATNKEAEEVSDVKLRLYDGGENGRLIRTIDLGALGSAASKPIKLQESDWAAASLDEASSTKTIYCVIAHSGVEYSLWDNSVALTRAVEKKKPDTGSNSGTTKPVTPSVPSKPSSPAPSVKPAAPQKVSLAKAAVVVKSKIYTGKTLKPAAPVVKVGGKTLKVGTDFTYSCKGGKKVGSYKVTIKGKGAYTGTKVATFKVIPKSTSISKVIKARKGFTVKWKGLSKAALKQVTGYEIRYSTSKKFTAKTTKSKKVKAFSAAGKKRTLKVGKLKGNKKYYVQVRTYKKVGGKVYASAWSKAKAVKTRK